MEVAVAVDADRSDLLACLYHMSIVSWMLLIALCRSGTIGQNKVQINSWTIFCAVFKAIKEINDSTPLFNHSLIWKFKISGAFWVDAYWFWSPDSQFAIYCPQPLSNSLVKETVNSLQLCNLLVCTPEQGDKVEALRVANLAAKFSCSGCLWFLQFVFHSFWLFKTSGQHLYLFYELHKF